MSRISFRLFLILILLPFRIAMLEPYQRNPGLATKEEYSAGHAYTTKMIWKFLPLRSIGDTLVQEGLWASYGTQENNVDRWRLIKLAKKRVEMDRERDKQWNLLDDIVRRKVAEDVAVANLAAEEKFAAGNAVEDVAMAKFASEDKKQHA